jgi:hypothetical protein
VKYLLIFCSTIVCLGVSISLAIIHGWADAVRIVHAVAALAFFLGVIWFVRQSARRLPAGMGTSTASALGEPSEQAILADAAEPYILYPAKGKIARRLVILLMAAASLEPFSSGRSHSRTALCQRLYLFSLRCSAGLPVCC